MSAAPDRSLRVPHRVPRIRGEVVVLAGVVALIAWAALVPLVYLLARALAVDGRLTFGPMRAAFRDDELLPLVANSLAFAAGATLLATTIGTTLAYLVERTDLPFRRAILVAALVPLIVPGILYTISWIFLAAPRTGALNTLVEPVLGPGTFDVFGLGGMILVEGLHLAPVVLLIMVAAFRSLDPALEESARMSSANEVTVFRRVSLPLVRPALAIAVLLVLIRSLEAFEVPALLGMPGGTWVLTSRIWRALTLYPVDYGTASAFALLLLALTALGVYLHTRLSRRGRRFQTVTGKGFRAAPVRLRGWRWPVTTLVGLYLLLAVALPMLILLYVSTQPFYASPSLARLGEATFANYVEVVTDAASVRAAKNSVVLAVAAASAAVLLGAVAAWLVVRTRIRGRWVVSGLALIPLVMPGLVLGQAILFTYLRLPLPVYGTLWILLIAYVTRYMPYGIASATASMYQVGSELEESAQTSGAGWWPTFRRIVLPLVAPGLVAGWIAVVIFALRELSSSILLYSPGDEVLAVQLWEEFQSGRFGQVAALGVLMVVGLLPLVGAAYAFGSRAGIAKP